MKPYVFGVDLGGTTVKIGFFQSNGELIEKWEIPTRAYNHGANLLPDIAQALLGKLTEKSISVEEVEGVGLGVPGAVLPDGYVKPCVNLDQWGGFYAAQELSELCHCPVKLVNDANAAALGEMYWGGGKGYRNVVFVTLGTGVGGGIILNGKLLTGVHGAGGEIGHMKVAEADDVICGCGKSGCLEQYSSATGLVNRAKRLLSEQNMDTRLRSMENLTCKDIFDCAKEGDPAAAQLVDDMSRMLGKALANVACVCDPEIVVIGGGVARAGDILLQGIREQFAAHAFPATLETKFALAELGNDAGIYGASQMILNEKL
ncbi:ROK family glucokinase [Butyricicoccus sp.]|uniref:ROK family glucokinase n=1 Tax=Butyricicoccus sp. TaxID=2049021 RepID=UPI003F191889